MISFGSILIVFVLVITLFLAIIAIVRGYKGVKNSKCLDTSDKKVKTGYWLLSVVHMWMGILVTLCYLIVGLLILNKL